MTESRELKGEVFDQVTWKFPGDEPDELRVVAKLPGGTWELPVAMFADAGYTIPVEIGTKFSALTDAPVGMPPRSIQCILPPVDGKVG